MDSGGRLTVGWKAVVALDEPAHASFTDAEALEPRRRYLPPGRRPPAAAA
ncbi:MAG TPA: hypothetical protein VG674_27935 [Amycolatopsis sp.]|nr:hypothetical protein [Amycolatopsis sp.]